MPKYCYDGPVLEFDICVADHWRGETIAPSESKARSNLAYQYKKKNNRVAGTRVTLPGRITEIG
jgi:hypothetical protein